MLPPDPANNAPENKVPAALSVDEDTDLSIIGLSIGDSDAGNGPMKITLSVLHGTLTVASAGGASVKGSGTAVNCTGITCSHPLSEEFFKPAGFRGSSQPSAFDNLGNIL